MGFLFIRLNISKKGELKWKPVFICNGPLGFLGILGFLIHFRCLDCGVPGVVANDETFQLLDILANTPFETSEQYWRFSLVSC